MRDTKALHPELQKKITKLQKLCKQNGITISISECVRTVAEQDALYAKGRTKSGVVVTNCKGNSYSSMHQWGVAFDFILNMDIDGDGKTSDDIYNNSTRLFNKVGKLGQSIGLEWGGSWKSIVDIPHFQLKDWGSTAKNLKAKYGTPDKFMKTWTSTSTTSKTTSTTTSVAKSTTPASKSNPVAASNKKTSYNKKFTTKAGTNLRLAPVNGGVIITVPKGKSVTCYGYYTNKNGYDWLFVQYGKYTGYIRRDLLG